MAKGKADRPLSYAWVVLGAIFVASVAAPVNQFKVPPVMPVLMADFDLTMTSAGLLMSLFSLSGLLAAFPAGGMLVAIGKRRTVGVALVFLMFGSFWGGFAQSEQTLFISRMVEGAGMAILGVAAPAIIAAWFPRDQRGLPMGIWSAWVSCGVIFMMNASPAVTPDGQWAPTWWLGTGVAVAAFLAFQFFYREAESGIDASTDESVATTLVTVLSIRDVWLVSIALFCFNIMVLALNTFYPTYLVQVMGFPAPEADFYASLPNIVMLVSCPLGGWLADRAGTRKYVFSIALGLLSLWWVLAFRAEASSVPVFMVLFGLLAGPVISSIITALPEAVRKPQYIGLGMSLLMFWHHLGEFVGPIYFGELLDSLSWETASVCMVPVCLIGGACGLGMRVR